MTVLNSSGLLLVCGIALVLLTGCQQIEQAATDAVEQAKQTAVQAIDEAKQAGSIDEARQTATDALQDVRQQAAGLLGQASELLSVEPQDSAIQLPEGEDATTAL